MPPTFNFFAVHQKDLFGRIVKWTFKSVKFIVYKYRSLFSSWRHSFLCVIISSKLTLLIGTSYLPDWSLVTDPCWWQRHLACGAIGGSLPGEFKFVWPWLILVNIPLPLFCSFALGFQNLEFHILSPTLLSYFTLLFSWKVLLLVSKHTLLYVSSVSF